MASSPLENSSGDLTVIVYSDGTALDETVQLMSVEVTRAANRIPSARLVVLDGDMPNDTFPLSDSDAFKPGKAIKVTAGYGAGAHPTLFEGVVVRHGLRVDGNNFARLIVDCRDKAAAMTLGRKCANFVDQKDSDIIGKLIGAYGGLSAEVSATTSQYKELVQYYVSDWDFMLARAEANGMVAIVEAGTVAVKPPATAGSPVLTLTYGIDLIEFQADLDARSQLSGVDGAAWDPAAQEVIEQHAAPPTLNAQGDIAAAALAEVLGLASFRLQSAVPLDSGSLKAWADGQQLKAGLARIRGRAKFQGSALAKPGVLVELKGVGARFNGAAWVSAVTQAISGGSWTTEAEFGMAPEWFSENAALAAPLAGGLTAGVPGLQVGVVKKLDADPDGQYKVQVSVPLMQAEADGVWARLAGFYGSEGIGAFFVPEIGDEVVLGYFNNDPSHPIILGSLYSSKRKPPYEITADNFTKAIVTRSKLTLEFDEDKKVITIVTPGKNKIVISDDAKSILLQDQNGNKVELKPEGIVLDSPKDIAISAKGKVTIAAVGNIELSSKADLKGKALNVNHEASIGLVAKGGASAELSASGQTTVKGAMVMIN